MPTAQNGSDLQSQLSKAFAHLYQGHFEAYFESLRLLGRWVQTELKLPCFKDHETELNTLLAEHKPKLRPVVFEQSFAFTVFENAWHDQAYSRLKSIQFTSNPEAPASAHSCLFLRQEQAPFWQVIPVDADGNKLKPLDIKKLDELGLMAPHISASLADKAEKDYTDEERALVARVLHVLKRAREEKLDQSALLAKAELSKECRQQLRLGLEALKHFMPQPDSIKPQNEELDLIIQDQPLEPRQFAGMKENSYLLIPPKSGQPGRVLFYKSRFLSPIEIDDEILKEVLKEGQQTNKDDLIKNLNEEENLKAKMYFYILDYHQRQLDQKARQAIRHYQTTSQKLTRVIGNVLAAVTAVTYGGVELIATMLGFFIAAAIVWSSPWLALGGVLLLAGAVILPFPSTWANWKVFSTYMPEFFNKIGQEYGEINGKGKKSLFWGLSLFALATGVAAGGLAYTATIALPLMLGLGTVASAFFPPIGVLLALAIVVTQTCMLIRNFGNILRKEYSWEAFKAPFLKVNKILKDSNAGWGRRLLTWAMVAGLSILSILGLAMSCFTSTRSVGKLFIDQLGTAPQKALYLGIMIGAIGAFIARVYFTLDSAISSALILCKRWFQGKADDFFSKNYQDYRVLEVNEVLSAEALAQRVDMSQFAADEKIIILTKSPQPAEVAKPKPFLKKINELLARKKPSQTGLDENKRVYFVMANQLVNTDKGILTIDLKLGKNLSKALTERQSPSHQAVVEKSIEAATEELKAKQSKPLPIPFKKAAAIAIDSALAGGFYAQNMLALSAKTAEDLQHDVDLGIGGLEAGPAALLATGALLTAGARYVAIDLKHADTPEDPYVDSKKRAALARGKANMDFYFKHNPHSLFAEGKSKNWGIQHEKPEDSKIRIAIPA